MQKIHDKDSHYSTSTREEFLQNILIGNITIEEEEYIHPNGRAMIISGLIQGNIVLADPSLAAINKSYFGNLTRRNEANFLADKAIVLNNLGAHQGRVNITHTSMVQPMHCI